MYEDILKHHLAMHSRSVRSGDVFFAQDSRFVTEAVQNGATMIVCAHQDEYAIQSMVPEIRTIAVENVMNAFYYCVRHKYPQGSTNLYAVTGTDGKSSVVNYFVQLTPLSAAIGTLGVSVSEDLCLSQDYDFKCTLTTPDCLTLHKIIHQLSEYTQRIAFEASSHGLIQERVAALDMHAGVFTSFSTDHLDYHQTMENYLRAKMLLWQKYVNIDGYAIVNADVERNWHVMCNIPQKNKIIYGNEHTVSQLDLTYAMATYRIIEQNRHSCTVLLHLDGKERLCTLPVICAWQIENVFVAMILAYLDGECIDTLCEKAEHIRAITGRLERVARIAHVDIFVDYAHTVGSVQSVLSQLPYDRKVLVMACAGNRCVQKREIMAQSAAQLCDVLIITDDNTRDEDPADIRKQIYDSACSCPKRRAKEVFSIAGRQNAIKFAVEFCIEAYNTADGDVALIVAGKGHEQYQEICGERVLMSDHEIIRSVVRELSPAEMCLV